MFLLTDNTLHSAYVFGIEIGLMSHGTILDVPQGAQEPVETWN